MLELVQLRSASRVALRISFFISLVQVYTLVVGSCSVEICEVYNLWQYFNREQYEGTIVFFA